MHPRIASEDKLSLVVFKFHDFYKSSQIGDYLVKTLFRRSVDRVRNSLMKSCDELIQGQWLDQRYGQGRFPGPFNEATPHSQLIGFMSGA